MKYAGHILFFILAIQLFGLIPTERLANQLPQSSDFRQCKILLRNDLNFESLQGSRQERIAEAKGISEDFSLPLKALLEGLEAQGHVRDLHMLWIVPGALFEADAHAIRSLISYPLDGFIDLDPPLPALMESYDTGGAMETEDWDTLAWGVQRSQASAVWKNYGLTGRGVRVAIFDTGIQPNHPDLIDNLWVNRGEIPRNGIDDDENGYIDDEHGYDFVSNRIQYDDRGHGTHVAGTVAGTGAAGMKSGVAPDVELMSVKVINDEGSGIVGNSWRGVEYALLMKAHIANLSIGWTYREGLDRGGWRAVVENAKDLGLLFCVACGNEGGDEESCDDLRCPGDVPDAFSIGAHVYAGYYAGFSGVGPVCWDDVDPYYDYPFPPGLTKPDILGPGDDIPSCALTGDYVLKSGTSMATPHVAGVCALLMQMDTTRSPDFIEALIESTAHDIGIVGHDNRNGWGRMQAEQAVLMAIGWPGWIRITSLPNITFHFEPQGLKASTDDTGELILCARGGVEYTFTTDAFGFWPDSGSVTFAPDTTEISIFPSASDSFPLLIEVLDMATLEPIEATVYSDRGDTAEYTEGFHTGLWGWESHPTVVHADKVGYRSEMAIFPNDDRRKRLFLHRANQMETFDGFYWDGDFEFGLPLLEEPMPRSGLSCLATSLSGNYSDLSDSRVITTDWFTPADSTALLTFFHWYEIEATTWGIWDGGNVQVRTSTDTTWRIIHPLSRYPGHVDDFNELMAWQPAISGTLWGIWWQQEVFPLADYAGESIKFMFRFASDDNTNYRGWYIDDFLFTETELHPPVIRNSLTGSEGDTLRFFCEAFGIYEPIDTSGVYMHYIMTDFGGIALEDSLRMTWSTGTDAFNAALGMPFYAEIDYFFSARDDAGLWTRYPADSSLHVSFGGDSIPPVIHFPWYRQNMIISDTFFIRAVITDSLTGIDTSSISMEFHGFDTLINLSPFEIRGDTALFGWRLPYLPVEDNICSLSIGAGDIFDPPNNSVTDFLPILFDTELELAADSDTSVFRDLGGDSIWVFDLDDGWECNLTRTGVDSLVIGDINLAIPASWGWIEAEMYLELSYELWSGSGLDFHTDLGILYPEGGYTGYLPTLMSDGLSGVSGEPVVFDVLDHIGSIFDLVIRIGSDGTDGNVTLTGLRISGSDGIDETQIVIPLTTDIDVCPNPFNGAVTIDIAEGAEGDIFDIRGNLIHTLEGGRNIWRPDAYLPTGVYLVKADLNGKTTTRRLIYLK